MKAFGVNKGPAISVVVPVYNAEKYIKRGLDSLLQQKAPDFEVIIIDDGSSDGSGAICDSYAQKDSRFHVFHQENKGIAKTRLRGVWEASGDYIVWMDSDDWVSSDMIEIFLEQIRDRNPDIVIYGHKNIYVNHEVTMVPAVEEKREAWQRKALLGENAIVWQFMARRSLWAGLNVPEELRFFGEDGYLSIQLFLKAKKIVSLQKILYFHDARNMTSLSHCMNGETYYAHFFLWRYRESVCYERYRGKVAYCVERAISNGVKAYALWVTGQALPEGAPEAIRKGLWELAKEPVCGRWRDRILSWCIRHDQRKLVSWYGHYKINRTKN